MFSLTIETGNAAFEDDMGGELARILHNLAEGFEEQSRWVEASGAIRDINGNTVARWTLTAEEN